MTIDQTALQEMRQAYELTGNVYKTRIITGRAVETIEKYLKKEIAKRKKEEKALVQRVKKEFEKLKSASQTAQNLNMEEQKVLELVGLAKSTNYGRGMRPDGKYGSSLSQEKENLIYTLAQRGESVDFIASKANCGKSTVVKKLKEKGHDPLYEHNGDSGVGRARTTGNRHRTKYLSEAH